MSDPQTPASGSFTPSIAVQVLGGKQLKEAAESFGRATERTTETNKKLNERLAKLASALEALSRTLGQSRGLLTGGTQTATQPTGTGHWTTATGHITYGANGGGPRLPGAGITQGPGRTPTGHVSYGDNGGTQPTSQPAERSRQPAERSRQAMRRVLWTGHVDYGPNGGRQIPGMPGGWYYTPYGIVPPRSVQVAAGLLGHTPRGWATRNTLWTAAGEGARALMQGAITRGVQMMPDQLVLDAVGAYERQLGIAQYQNLTMRYGVLGAFNPSGWMNVGEMARASVQSVQDAAQGQLTTLRFTGAGRNAPARIQSIQRAADALGFANPGLSWSQSVNLVGQMLRPSTRLNFMMLGLPDPTAPDGSYRGNARFFDAFLKRIYGGKESVPPDIFEDDFREGGVGLENLRMLLGDEGAEVMLEPLRRYNEAKFRGKNVSDFDIVLSEANLSGERGERARRIAQEKYGFEPTAFQQEQRIAAKARASELAGHEEFMDAYELGASAAETFADAVHEFVNAPFVKEIKNWTEAFFGRLFGGNARGVPPGNGIGGSLSAQGPSGVPPGNGIGGLLTAQGPEPKANRNDPNTTASGDTGADDKESGPKETRANRLEKLREELVAYAKSFVGKKLRYAGRGYERKRNEPGWADCSSFVSRVYARFGYTVGPTTVQLWRQGVGVPLNKLLPGDVLLSGSRTEGGGAAHAGIYLGDGMVIDVSSGRGDRAARIWPMKYWNWEGARRIIGAKGIKQGDYDPLSKDERANGGGSGSNDDGSSSTGVAADNVRYGIMSAGLGGGSMGLGSPNAAAYSTSEYAALAAILSGGGGGGMLLTGDPYDEAAGDETSASSADAADGSSTDSSTDSGTESSDSADGSKLPKRGTMHDRYGPFRRDKFADTRDTQTIRWGEKYGASGKWTQNFAPKNAPKPNIAANKDYARRAAKARFGWGDDEFRALNLLWESESGWNQYADNPYSDAYGIPQALPGWKMAEKGRDWRINPRTQIDWGLEYIKKRYGTPSKAWAFKRAKNWYEKGAWEIQSDEVAQLHKGEMVIPAQQARRIRDVLLEENIDKPKGTQYAVTPPSSAGITVNLNFQPGAISLHAGGTAHDAQSLARQFIRELEKQELYTKIMRGEGVTIAPVS